MGGGGGSFRTLYFIYGQKTIKYKVTIFLNNFDGLITDIHKILPQQHFLGTEMSAVIFIDIISISRYVLKITQPTICLKT